MAEHDYIFLKKDGDGKWQEKTVTAIAGNVLAFNQDKEPVMYDIESVLGDIAEALDIINGEEIVEEP